MKILQVLCEGGELTRLFRLGTIVQISLISSKETSGGGDESFLLHFERLSHTLEEAKQEQSKLLAVHEMLKQKLNACEAERDLEAQRGSLLASENLRLEAQKLQQSITRRNFEDRLNQLLEQEAQLAASEEHHTSNQEGWNELQNTTKRLQQGINQFNQSEQESTSGLLVPIRSQLQLDRTKAHLLRAKQQVQDNRMRFEQAHQNEVKLREKLWAEKRKNEESSRGR
jgi:hypothetical protein